MGDIDILVSEVPLLLTSFNGLPAYYSEHISYFTGYVL